MNTNQWTQKSLEALGKAQNLAVENGNPELSSAHLLSALLAQEESLIAQLLVRMNADPSAVARESERLTESCPSRRAARCTSVRISPRRSRKRRRRRPA